MLGGHHIHIVGRHRYGGLNDDNLTHAFEPISIWYDRPCGEYHLTRTLPADSPTHRVKPLAGVCRQSHQETSLLLYQTNLFTFSSAGTMRGWLESLRPIQIRALRRVILPWRAMWPSGWQRCLLRTHMKHLTGLIEVYDWDPGTRVLERKWQGLDYEIPNVPERPRGFPRAVHPATVHIQRVQRKAKVASRASNRIKSRLKRADLEPAA